MMKNLSDERLEKMLTDYCKADSSHSFVYDPEAAADKEKIIPFARFNRMAAAAASLVLVSVLSLIVYFSFGNKKDAPLAVAPSHQGVITPSAPAGGSGGDPSNDSSEDSDGSGTVFPTENKSDLLRFFEDLIHQPTESKDGTTTKDKNTDPTTSFSKGSVKSSRTPNATERSSAGSNNNTTSPTEKSHASPKPTVPIAPPQVEPTEGSGTHWQPEETESCDPPWNEPTEPDEGSGGEPCDPPSSEIPPPVDLYGSISKSRMPDDNIIYCKVYDNRGRLMGDRNLYSSQHIAEIVREEDTSVLVVYTTPEGMIYFSGYYNYVFYDSNGTLLAQGQEYVEV